MKLKLLIVAFAMLLVTNASANIVLEKSTVGGMAINMTTNIMLVMTKSEANFRYLTEIVAKRKQTKKRGTKSKKSRTNSKKTKSNNSRSGSQPRQGSSQSTQKRSESR